MCHLCWKYSLMHSHFSHVADVEKLPYTQANDVVLQHQMGAVRLTLDNGLIAMFRSCSIDASSFANELLVHEIDRLLHLHRTPAVALRQVLWNDLLVLNLAEDVLRDLQRVREKCHNNANVLSGVVVGWTKADLQVIPPSVLSTWLDRATFDAAKPTQRLVRRSESSGFF
jgi:hypothetical protein